MARKKAKTEPDEPTSALGKAGRGAKGFATRSVFNRDRLAVFRFGAEQLGNARTLAMDAVRPQPFSAEEAREGFHGRYRDGGAARFRELMGEHEVSADRLATIERGHVMTSRTFLGMGIVSLLVAFVFMNLSDHLPVILGSAGLALCSLVMMVMAIKFDFSAFQVRNRRIAGFREYMEDRHKRPGSGVSAAAAPRPPQQG